MIYFDNVSKIYSDGTVALEGVTFSVKQGEFLSIVGHSGAGKTTFVDILLGLFPIGSGEILLDGENISKVSKRSWRNNIGYVSQDTFLLNDTIENNIRFYDIHMSNEDIVRATKLANIYDFIEQLPDKLSTIVGERGVKLSGGQKQRLTIARALLKKPEILIFDEATSALDQKSEEIICEALEDITKNKTVIMISHRMSLIKKMNRVLTIQNKQLIELPNGQYKETELR